MVIDRSTTPGPHSARYDEIGVGYSTTRREDPRIREMIHAALGSGRSVLNVGAGSGSYEPHDRFVVAVEPSRVMADQRADDRAASIRCSAAPLPLRDAAVDGSMAVLTVHHWDEELEPGLRELRRVTRGPIVIVTFDAHGIEPMWLLRDYLTEAADLDRVTFPTIDALAELLGGRVAVAPIPVASDTPDWSLASFWAHPERVLDPLARNGTSGFTRQPAEVVDRVVAQVREDLGSGEWERRNGHLRALEEFDVGLRLVVAHP